jgi:hypothetical protein
MKYITCVVKVLPFLFSPEKGQKRGSKEVI